MLSTSSKSNIPRGSADKKKLSDEESRLVVNKSRQSSPTHQDPSLQTDAHEVSLHKPENSKQSYDSMSLKKLLNSHLSIFNALNNPDLDVSMAITPPRFTPDLMEPAATFSAWQSISTDSIFPTPKKPTAPPVAKTASILSMSTDDEYAKESTVIIPSPKPTDVMVFETDEEGDDEHHEIIKPSSFIMPKLSVSDNIPRSKDGPLKISVLISHDSYKFDTNQLINSIETDLECESILIHHISLQPKASLSDSHDFDEAMVRNSDLIFIVNDGSFLFVDFLNGIFEPQDREDEDNAPKLTIINIMTVNYFINLLDLINNLDPYQIWKTTSLKEEKLVDRLKNFIEVELIHQNKCTQLTEKNKNLNMTLHHSLDRSRTLYSTFISKKKPDYKYIEKQFKSELLIASTYADPLRISKSCSYINILQSIASKLVYGDGEENISRVWLLCSFSLGIGMGVGIASGLASIIGYYVCNSFPIAVTPPPPEVVKPGSWEFGNVLLEKFPELLTDFASATSKYFDQLRSVGGIVIEGFEKLIGILFYYNY